MSSSLQEVDENADSSVVIVDLKDLPRSNSNTSLNTIDTKAAEQNNISEQQNSSGHFCCKMRKRTLFGGLVFLLSISAGLHVRMAWNKIGSPFGFDGEYTTSKIMNFGDFLNWTAYTNNQQLAAGTEEELHRLATQLMESGTPVDRFVYLKNGKEETEVSAADALVCRDSVKNFVINATNGKDECQGLQKAFDKTCSDDEPAEFNSGASFIAEAQRGRRGRHRRRKLEDEVKRHQKKKRNDLRRRLVDQTETDTTTTPTIAAAAATTEQNENENVNVNENVTTLAPIKKSTLLGLPTAKEHVTDKVLNEALLLQHEEKIIMAVTNATNSTQKHEEAIKDAATSSKAVSYTTDIVSAVLNDPTSVEARTCCASIMNVYHELCSVNEEEVYSDRKLFFVVLIMALCGVVKSLIRHFKIRWVPEAAGCILVGVFSGYGLTYFPHQSLSFDGNYFIRVLVPPIVFEAAISMDKKSFNRHIVPILLYAIAGTLFATYLTALIVNKGTAFLGELCPTIPFVESLTFGALISSIDPIAVLSVLSNMGMTDTDTLYVLIFGESLLNDGVAIVLFHTLVHFLDETLEINKQAIIEGAAHFLVVSIGSLLVGIGSGMACTAYYWTMHGCQTPLVEVLMFFCWALVPYYICDGVGWSGIVSVVATGFVMDLHVIGADPSSDDSISRKLYSTVTERANRKIFSGDGHLSLMARTHIGFVTEIVSTMMETAIFAYLGLFLFSHRYHWDRYHAFIAIFGCLVSRGVMITCLSTVANCITNIRKNRAVRQRPQLNEMPHQHPPRKQPPNPYGTIVDKRMQLALWVAGLRGAMSFALVEYIPLYDAVTGEGSRFKAELKAMTSVSILFTVFVLGGLTHYTMDLIGLAPGAEAAAALPSLEMASLLEKSEKEKNEGRVGDESLDTSIDDGILLDKAKDKEFSNVRQRQGNHDI